MSFSLTAGMAMSALKALLRFRGRLDMVLALQEASADLPFALPPAPTDTDEHYDAMVAYFESERGQLLLELRELATDFDAVKADRFAGSNREKRRRLFQVFYEATDTVPARLGPNSSVVVRAPEDMRLAFYVVGSQRLSRNKAVSRVLLAAADTILEFAGENAGSLISDPKVAGVVQTVLEEFAIKHDFDDDSSREIFEKLMGAAMTAVTRHATELSDAPAVSALVKALADFRAQHGDNAAAEIMSLDGFAGLLGKFATHVADDPAFQPDDPRLATVLSATLKEIGSNLPKILHDPGALLGVLEVTLTSAAGQVESLLDGKLGGKPLITQVLVAVAKEVETRGQEQRLLRSGAGGELLNAVFKTALTTIAANPESLKTTAKVNGMVAMLVTQAAEVLSHRDLNQVLTAESMREIASRGLKVLADNPDALEIDSEFASKVVTGVLKAASSAVVDGLAFDDLETLAGAAVRVATDNLRLLEMDDRLVVVLEATGNAFGGEGIRKLLSPNGRREALFEIVGVVAANPTIWDGLAKAELVQPVVQAVIQGLATDPSKLLSGPTLVASIRQVLLAVARRGKRVIDGEVDQAMVRKVLEFALKHVEKEIGTSIDGENLPDFLERVVLDYLRAPFQLSSMGAADYKALIEKVLEETEAA